TQADVAATSGVAGTGGRMNVTVRDMTACEILEDSRDVCERFDTRESRYDTVEQLDWRIVNQGGLLGIGGLGGVDGTTLGSTIAVVAGLGALQGVLSGGGVDGVLSGAINGVSTLAGGLNGLN